MTRRNSALRRLALVAGVLATWGIGAASPAVAAAASLDGTGSSFAGPEINQWIVDTGKSPYNLNMNYTSQSSSDGRFQFANQTVDYGVSDIPYQPAPFDTAKPNFPFMYVPVTAGGLAFMYHIDGFSKTLQLSSYSACAIFTGGVTNWDDPIIAADNPGASLPNLEIHPVIRSDLAGTNFVFQEWCIHEQPQLWAAFATSPAIGSIPGQVADRSPTQPRSDWPIFNNAVSTSGSSSAADIVANSNDDGYITAVETAYAIQHDNYPVASVKNASGLYTQPTAVDVASALAYATQQANGTHVLNFDGTGPHVYNPSTYSYLLSPTSGWNSAKGAALSQFVDYALTLGQIEAPKIGYASLGLSLERYGVDAMKNNVPGAVSPSTAEQNAYACGDLTPSEVQAGQTTPTCGVTNATANTPASTTPSGGSGGSGAGASSVSSRSVGGGGGPSGGGVGTGGPGATAAADPSVSLDGSPSLAYTGGAPIPIAIGGSAMLVGGFVARRRLRARSAS